MNKTSNTLEKRLAKFQDLVPSKVPFVEGKLKGHQDRSNYSIVGPGVSEDSKQNVASTSLQQRKRGPRQYK